MKTIIEGNKLIDAFMLGHEHTDSFGPNYFKHLSYHKDWNDLMPVVEKIENIATEDSFYSVRIQDFGCSISASTENFIDLHLPLTLGDTKIENVWEAIVYFIQWYNEQQTQ